MAELTEEQKSLNDKFLAAVNAEAALLLNALAQQAGREPSQKQWNFFFLGQIARVSVEVRQLYEVLQQASTAKTPPSEKNG